MIKQLGLCAVIAMRRWTLSLACLISAAGLVIAPRRVSVTPNWTAKLEYDFLGLNNVQTLTVGLNYLFNWH
jgi:hypothetical protein